MTNTPWGETTVHDFGPPTIVMMTDAELDAIEERALDQTNWVIGAPRPEELSRDCLLLIAELRRYRQARGWPSGILANAPDPFSYPPDWLDRPPKDERPWWRFW